MTKAEIFEDIIEGYRNSIRERYQYPKLRNSYKIPDTIREETVVGFRDFIPIMKDEWNWMPRSKVWMTS